MSQYVQMSKLTLSVDPAIVVRAKRYAQRQGTSISSMVQAYLTSLTRPSSSQEAPPILRSIRGILKTADLEEYRRHVAEKHR